jgi:hypothetical protein
VLFKNKLMLHNMHMLLALNAHGHARLLATGGQLLPKQRTILSSTAQHNPTNATAINA